MQETIQSLREAREFIMETWTRNGYWSGPVDYFQAACTGSVTKRDIQHLMGAIMDGEPSPVVGLTASYAENGEIKDIYIFPA
jgi:hypothetical protein